MDIDRAVVQHIRAEERQKVLADFGLAQAKPLAIGTEAEVYELDGATLLKLYANISRLPHFQTLHKLYNTVDISASSLTLPKIYTIASYENLIAIVETRLSGEPLESLLPYLQGEQLERVEALYLDAVWQLKEVKVTEAPTTYLLFDEVGMSDTSQQSFAAFYAGFLEQKVAKVGRFFQSSTPSFIEKTADLVQTIRSGKSAPLCLVHGDFFPGNLLVDKHVTRVEGMIDFGSFTLFGNYLLDVAGAFGFYKMYDPQRRQNRARMMPQILARLAAAEKPRFFQFLLANAILTSDLYATTPDPRGDDHFQWAAEIVSNDSYWDAAL